ncbi:plasmid partitioning protein RepB [Microvirga arsenatis]|uniref:Plasmid partitioning protein RepB n=1 Tax=Microvirga arsenatis TaxID=2692265 RepID=A0ABW9Z3E7_9HYPH|nr:plasmid partitioning protein RepB [Microvirga arsenatis]NBJ13765.1 plasmid partitioning protein RepB [Microvirga arsenatis]NBJ27219.1 plasmid partitioning protein RepB [Microvirga arsenatis]
MRKGILIARPTPDDVPAEQAENIDARAPRSRVRPLLNAPGLVADPAARPVGALGQSLNEFQAKAQRAEEIEQKLAQGQTVVELDPTLIDPSFVSDRLPNSEDAHQRLVDAIRENGQLIPILVRPHPEKEGHYQVAFGHRRLRAVKELGRQVRAIVRNLSDEELVIAQGQENNEREDLSFIERALFAHHLERKGFSRATITAALSVHKTDLSTMLSIVARIPASLIEGIGPAPKTGRRSWMALADGLKGKSEIKKAEAAIASENFRALDSDARFAVVAKAITPFKDTGAPITIKDPKGRQFARAERTASVTVLKIDEKVAPAFGQYLLDKLPELLAAFESQREKADG